LIVAIQNLSPHGALRFANSHDLGNPEYLNNGGVGDHPTRTRNSDAHQVWTSASG
jgi:hypothetical protein